MPRKSRGSRWPATADERADRCVVVDLVHRVGTERLHWTVADLQRTMRDNARFRLTHPAQLARHLGAIVPLTVTPVAQPLAAFAAGAGGAAGDRGNGSQLSPGGYGSRTRHVYVLTARLPEHDVAIPPWPQAARVYVALWVAVEALGASAVDTNAVTRVCGTIDALSVDGSTQMTTRLAGLAKRSVPLVRRAGAVSEGPATPLTRSRWRRWTPVGARPDDPRFDDWVAVVRSLEEGITAPQRVGHVTVHDIAAELVDIAITRSCSPFWPQGRSVTVEDIAAACGADDRARELDALLAARGTTRGRVLGDASKARIAGRDRVHRQIVKAGVVPGGRAYYDIPGRPGHEARALVVPYEIVRAALRPEVFDDLAREYKSAARLQRESGALAQPVLAAMAAVRIALVHAEVDALERASSSLEAERHRLSEQATRVLNRQTSRIAETRGHLGVECDEAQQIAHDRVAAVGHDVNSVLGATRPLLTGEELLAWIPHEQRHGRTGPQLLADATLLARFSNAAHTHRGDAIPQRAAVTAVDRVDALVYLSEKYAGRTLAFLQNGAELLGRGLRDARLPRLLLASDDERLWARGLAALALLGDESAESAALDALASPRATIGRVVRALYALAVLRRCVPEMWPDRVRSPREPEVVNTVRQVLGATRTGRWLL